jgi:hypothetical protein
LFEESFSIFLQCNDAIYNIARIDCIQGKITVNLLDNKSIDADFSVELNLLDKSGHLSVSASTRWGDLAVEYKADKDRVWQVDLKTRDLQLSIFSSILESFIGLFEGYSVVAGTANFQIEVEGKEQNVSNISLRSKLNALSIDREMYIQPGFSLLGEEPGFYIKSSDEAVIFRLAGNWLSEQRQFELQDFYYLHLDIIVLQGSTAVKFAEELVLSNLRLRAQIPDLGNSYPIYIQPILLKTNFSNLELSGAIDLSLDYKDSELRQMELLIDDVYLDDLDSRFSISAPAISHLNQMLEM